MLKALALENFWTPFLSAPKASSLKKTSVDSAAPMRFWLAMGLVAINLVLLMSYIYGVNDYASTGYQIKATQTRLAKLSDDNKKINLKISEANSMVSIQSNFLSANFVPAGTPKFLTVNSGSIQLTQR